MLFVRVNLISCKLGSALNTFLKFKIPFALNLNTAAVNYWKKQGTSNCDAEFSSLVSTVVKLKKSLVADESMFK